MPRQMRNRPMGMGLRTYPMMRRDGRNPYGSAGGYVSSSRAMDRDMNYDMARRAEYDRDYARRGYDRDMARRNSGQDMARRNYDQNYDREYDRDYNQDYRRDGIEQYYHDDSAQYDSNYDQHHFPSYSRGLVGYYGDTPFEVSRTYRQGRYNDYGYYDMNYNDYDEESEYLDKETIHKWTKKLLEKVEDKEMFSKEKVLKKAEEMGLKFEKVTPDEFYLTVLMAYTDYNKTFGNVLDTYIRIAKDWLMDDDVEKKYGKKLAAYYYNVVMDD